MSVKNQREKNVQNKNNDTATINVLAIFGPVYLL